MKRRILLGVVVLCLAGVVAAQPGAGPKDGAIVGQVFDSDLTAPIEYANVVLYGLPESTQVTGTVTDRNGSFRLDGVKPGRYYVELSFIGYRDRTVKEIEVAAGAQFDLGRLVLEQKAIAVPGVEATAEKPAISYEVDKKVVDVSKLPNAASGTAVDALRNVPSVKVDIEDNVTLRGSSNFKVLIDGKPTLLDANEALKQTPAQTIDKIEIITNPSAKYEPDGAAGIINILLKKQQGRGISALANANGGLDGSYGGGASQPSAGHRQHLRRREYRPLHILMELRIQGPKIRSGRDPVNHEHRFRTLERVVRFRPGRTGPSVRPSRQVERVGPRRRIRRSERG
jgi:hypothetical protein